MSVDYIEASIMNRLFVSDVFFCVWAATGGYTLLSTVKIHWSYTDKPIYCFIESLMITDVFV